MKIIDAPKVIIIGAGFGGLFAARTLAGKAVDVLLLDRNNYHTFTPLLYQVATCALDPSDIAKPIRGIFHDQANIRCLMGEVVSIHPGNQIAEIEVSHLRYFERYDYLIIATGSIPNYFNHTASRHYTFDLRTLDDAVHLRNHILRLFEKAIWTTDQDERRALTSFVVIGGGATGLETAGALYELYNFVLDKEYRGEKELTASVYLVEMLPVLLSTFPQKLQQAALDQISNLGVKVLLNNRVETITDQEVQLQDGTVLPTKTIIWAAGVKGNRIPGIHAVAQKSPTQIEISSTLEVPGYKHIYAVGDVAYLPPALGGPYPMVIPVAKQQGVLAAKNILRSIAEKPQKPFYYHDRGVMATIGRRRAVAWIYNRLPMRGFFAWLAWLLLHLASLIGFRNQLSVFLNWVWDYLTFDRSVRIILENDPE